MTKTAYAQYEKDIARNTEGLTHLSSGACAGCEECREDYGYDEEQESWDCEAEPGFAWSSYNVCGSHLGGDRYPVHAIDKDEIVHLEACDDCVYYLEYGHLDDQTMDNLT